MKKFLAILFVLAVCVTGVFAADTEFPTGTWIDENWDAKWVFAKDKVELYDVNGALVYTFTKDTTKDYAKDLAAGSAAGALSGFVFGALAGGEVGRGAALGTAVGAGGGLVKSIWDKGNDVEIPANAIVELLLTQPITTTATNYNY